MSKELKPYERENEILRKLRECKNSKQYLITQNNATKRGMDRNTRTYKRDMEVYAKQLEQEEAFLVKLDIKILDYSNQLKKFIIKPPKNKIIPIKNDKELCDICGNEYSKSGIKSHKKACLKKQEKKRLEAEIAKLDLEEVLDELKKGGKAKIELDNLTEDVSFIDIEEPKKEEGD